MYDASAVALEFCAIRMARFPKLAAPRIARFRRKRCQYSPFVRFDLLTCFPNLTLRKITFHTHSLPQLIRPTSLDLSRQPASLEGLSSLSAVAHESEANQKLPVGQQ